MMKCAICHNQFDSGLIEVEHGDQKSFWCPKEWNQWLDDQLDSTIDKNSYVDSLACPNETQSDNFDSHKWILTRKGSDELEIRCARCSTFPFDSSANHPCDPLNPL